MSAPGQNITVNGPLTVNLVGGNQTNHTVVCQPGGIPVSGLVSQIAGTTTLAGHVTAGALTISSNQAVPRLTALFTGRQDILDRLAQWFDPSKSSTTLKHQLIFVLYGPGGAGKTQIMAKFVNDFPERFNGVYYIDGTTLETIKASLEDIARFTAAGKTIEDALRWFARHRTEWLLLIDNADDPTINLRQFLPACTHGNVIITTRNRACRQHAPESNCNVSEMQPDDAVELLLKSSMVERSTRNRDLCASICRELGNFALAVAQAGAYIAQSCSLEDYLELYYEDRARLLQDLPIQTADDYQRTVYTTWEMSHKKLSTTAAMFLRLCAFMHHDGISKTIFHSAFSTVSGSELWKDGRKFLDKFLSSTGEWSHQKFVDIIKELTSFSLINVNAENHTYSIHPLIHAWSRERASASEYNESRICLLQILALSVPNGSSAEAFTLRRTLLPHIDNCRMGGLEPEIAERLATVYNKCGRWGAAAELQTLVVEAKKRSKGDENLDTIDTIDILACTHLNQGRWKDAEELDLHVLAARKRLLGDEHPDTVSAMVNLAYTYRCQGRWRDAEALDLHVLATRRRLFGHEHPDTILAMGALALTHRQQARWQDAEELQLEVLAASTRLFGDEHPDTLYARSNLASTYRGQGRYKDAEAIEVQVLSARKRLFGDHHPHTIFAMHNLASTYEKQGRSKDAEALSLEVITMSKQVLGDDHPDTIAAVALLASTFRGQMRWQEAHQLDFQVLEAQTRVLGDEHPDTVASKVRLASLYTTKGRLSSWFRHHLLQRS